MMATQKDSRDAQNQEAIDNQKQKIREEIKDKERFGKRSKTISNKIRELCELCDADAYVLIRWNNRIFTDSTFSDSSFLPQESDLVCKSFRLQSVK